MYSYGRIFQMTLNSNSSTGSGSTGSSTASSETVSLSHTNNGVH